MKSIYVASSWRNPFQVAVVAACRSAGLDAYDFKSEDEGAGFHWSDVMPSYQRSTSDGRVPVDEYLTGLNHPLAEKGFAHDFAAMQRCDACVLVLPCGRSAHLELGWFIGQGKPTAILLFAEEWELGLTSVIPELMYKLVDHISPDLMDLLAWLGVED